MKHANPLIILDRDGVINEDSKDYIKSLNEWHEIPGSLDAIVKLNQAGWLVAVATNQSGLSRGLTTLADVTAIHQHMQQTLKKRGGHIDAIAICPHLPEDHCACRKPKPGLLLEIAQSFHYLPKDLIVVGDSLRDIEAANAIGAKSYWVKSGKEVPEQAFSEVLRFNNLADVVTHLLRT